MSEVAEKTPRWQPVTVVLENGARLECKCEQIATIISGRLVNDHYNQLENVDVWCQDCFFAAQERGE